ncbi:MAG: DNA repair protein RadC [Spirochaetaceae bacterium]|nr:DNA repair protein RadC [Spirochaetaceae bacterium]
MSDKNNKNGEDLEDAIGGAGEVYDKSEYLDFAETTPAALPEAERPRERLFRYGPEALSDQEILSILLRTGSRGKNVSLLAAELLNLLERRAEIPGMKDLMRLTGVGKTKAAVIAAVLEFGRRRWAVTGKKIRSPTDIFNLIRHYADRKQERFISVTLNGAHEVIAVRVVTVGLVNRTIVHPREVFADPVADRSCAIVCAHNHPSGVAEPSREDDAVTRALQKAGDVLGIKLLDHLIFTETSWYSYRKAGKLDSGTYQGDG